MVCMNHGVIHWIIDGQPVAGRLELLTPTASAPLFGVALTVFVRDDGSHSIPKVVRLFRPNSTRFLAS